MRKQESPWQCQRLSASHRGGHKLSRDHVRDRPAERRQRRSRRSLLSALDASQHQVQHHLTSQSGPESLDRRAQLRPEQAPAQDSPRADDLPHRAVVHARRDAHGLSDGQL